MIITHVAGDCFAAFEWDVEDEERVIAVRIKLWDGCEWTLRPSRPVVVSPKPDVIKRLYDPEACAADDAEFLRLFDLVCAAGKQPSPVARSASYAPPLLKRFDMNSDLTVMDLDRAMDRLMTNGVLCVTQKGPPSRRRDVLVRNEGLFD
jgi:hypothetical protein